MARSYVTIWMQIEAWCGGLCKTGRVANSMKQRLIGVGVFDDVEPITILAFLGGEKLTLRKGNGMRFEC